MNILHTSDLHLGKRLADRERLPEQDPGKRRPARPMEFFFLDEGFGTLDSNLVDTVTDSLEKLRSEHFAIGIISHVEELKHRIEKKIYVEKATGNHGSLIHA